MKIDIWFKKSLSKGNYNLVKLLASNPEFERDIWKLRIIYSLEEKFKKERPDYFNELFEEYQDKRKEISLKRDKFGRLIKHVHGLQRKYNIPLSWTVGIVHIVRLGIFALIGDKKEKIQLGVGSDERYRIGTDKHLKLKQITNSGIHIAILSKTTKNELKTWIEKNWEKIEALMDDIGMPSMVGTKIKNIDKFERIAKLRDKKGRLYREIADIYSRSDEQTLQKQYKRYQKHVSSLTKKSGSRQ